MAYFANGTEGTVFDHQCSICKYGTCAMWKEFKNDFRIDPSCKEQELFK